VDLGGTFHKLASCSCADPPPARYRHWHRTRMDLPRKGGLVTAHFGNRTWGSLVVRGVLAILFGILAFARPGGTAVGLVYLFGVFAILDGIFAVVASADVAEMHGRWGALLLTGLVGIAIGILTFVRPAVTALGLVYYVAAWAVLTGALEVAAAIRLRKVVHGEWILVLAGFLSIACGVLIAARPGAGLLTLVWLVGGYALLFGVLEIGLGFRLRGSEHRHQMMT